MNTDIEFDTKIQSGLQRHVQTSVPAVKAATDSF